ncbi:hypothetical protein FOA52_001567 [Chlamydomonas sp. UWO 241]|nr:hypothetical protein FOA52_001567 [Chlamydomonas sp. UWO 241]
MTANLASLGVNEEYRSVAKFFRWSIVGVKGYLPLLDGSSGISSTSIGSEAATNNGTTGEPVGSRHLLVHLPSSSSSLSPSTSSGYRSLAQSTAPTPSPPPPPPAMASRVIEGEGSGQDVLYTAIVCAVLMVAITVVHLLVNMAYRRWVDPELPRALVPPRFEMTFGGAETANEVEDGGARGGAEAGAGTVDLPPMPPPPPHQQQQQQQRTSRLPFRLFDSQSPSPRDDAPGAPPTAAANKPDGGGGSRSSPEADGDAIGGGGVTQGSSSPASRQALPRDSSSRSLRSGSSNVLEGERIMLGFLPPSPSSSQLLSQLRSQLSAQSPLRRAESLRPREARVGSTAGGAASPRRVRTGSTASGAPRVGSMAQLDGDDGAVSMPLPLFPSWGPPASPPNDNDPSMAAADAHPHQVQLPPLNSSNSNSPRAASPSTSSLPPPPPPPPLPLTPPPCPPPLPPLPPPPCPPPPLRESPHLSSDKVAPPPPTARASAAAAKPHTTNSATTAGVNSPERLAAATPGSAQQPSRNWLMRWLPQPAVAPVGTAPLVGSARASWWVPRNRHASAANPAAAAAADAAADATAAGTLYEDDNAAPGHRHAPSSTSAATDAAAAADAAAADAAEAKLDADFFRDDANAKNDDAAGAAPAPPSAAAYRFRAQLPSWLARLLPPPVVQAHFEFMFDDATTTDAGDVLSKREQWYRLIAVPLSWTHKALCAGVLGGFGFLYPSWAQLSLLLVLQLAMLAYLCAAMPYTDWQLMGLELVCHVMHAVMMVVAMALVSDAASPRINYLLIALLIAIIVLVVIYEAWLLWAALRPVVVHWRTRRAARAAALATRDGVTTWAHAVRDLARGSGGGGRVASGGGGGGTLAATGGGVRGGSAAASARVTGSGHEGAAEGAAQQQQQQAQPPPAAWGAPPPPPPPERMLSAGGGSGGGSGSGSGSVGSGQAMQAQPRRPRESEAEIEVGRVHLGSVDSGRRQQRRAHDGESARMLSVGSGQARMAQEAQERQAQQQKGKQGQDRRALLLLNTMASGGMSKQQAAGGGAAGAAGAAGGSPATQEQAGGEGGRDPSASLLLPPLPELPLSKQGEGSEEDMSSVPEPWATQRTLRPAL